MGSVRRKCTETQAKGSARTSPAREAREKLPRKLSKPREGPCRILKANGNGSLKIQLRPCVADVASTKRVHPFFEKWSSKHCKLGSKATMEAGAVILPYSGDPLGGIP